MIRLRNRPLPRRARGEPCCTQAAAPQQAHELEDDLLGRARAPILPGPVSRHRVPITILPTTDTCPTLLAWLENDLPDEESQLLNTHVADCPVCREKLAVMNAVQDVGGVGVYAVR